MKRLILIAVCLTVAGCNAAPDLYTELVFNFQCQPLGGEFQEHAARQMLDNPNLKAGLDDGLKRIMIERIQTGEARWCRTVRDQIAAEGRWL
jgi:hypothetical protein